VPPKYFPIVDFDGTQMCADIPEIKKTENNMTFCMNHAGKNNSKN
jgi:hypothetical protein